MKEVILHTNKNEKLKILFLCTGNSCRSQMAEGWTRHLKVDCIEAWSAGVEIHGLDPLAVEAMAEVGIDISAQRSKHIREVIAIPFDYVVTVCDHARESCPLFPKPVIRIHRSFDDPPYLAKSAPSHEEKMKPYRRVRDEIRAFIDTLPGSIVK